MSQTIEETVEETMKQSMDNLSFLTDKLALNKLLTGLITFLVCYFLIRVIKTILVKSLDKTPKIEQDVKKLITKLVVTLLWVLTVIIVAGAFGVNVASLVAVLSVAGLALSLSIQNMLTNFFSGILLLVNKPFREGDFVEVGDKVGTVQGVGFFTTILCTPDNISISIPNGQLTSAAVKNYSTEVTRRIELKFSASYDAATETVKSAIHEAISADSRILMKPEPFVRLFSYDSSAITYVVRVWVKNGDYWDVYFDLNEKVRDAFERYKVEMTYDHINVHMLEK